MRITDIIEIAKSAGSVLKEGFGKNFRIEYKTNESNLVTEYDKKSESVIMEYISKKYPTHAILTEESGSFAGSSDYTWVIDPLDGTTNFAHGFPVFSVSIGVVRGTEVIAGCVYDVMRDDLYFAEKGAGCYRNDTKLTVSSKDKVAHSLLVTGFPYDVANNPYNAAGIFSEFLKHARGIRRLGSAAIDFCFVASGAFDGFWEVHLNPWDICAGRLLVEEAGGIVTDFYGNDNELFPKQILATNGIVHSEMINIIKAGFRPDHTVYPFLEPHQKN